MLESFVLRNRARNESKGLRRAPPGHDRSCQAASEQEGIEARGTSQCAPWGGERSPGRRAYGSATLQDALPHISCLESHSHKQGESQFSIQIMERMKKKKKDTGEGEEKVAVKNKAEQ